MNTAAGPTRLKSYSPKTLPSVKGQDERKRPGLRRGKAKGKTLAQLHTSCPALLGEGVGWLAVQESQREGKELT